MAHYEPLIEGNELKKDLFCGDLDSFYVVYDNDMDELIVRIVPPDRVVTTYYISETFALLVDIDSLQISGFQISEFQNRFLPQKMRNIEPDWYRLRLGKYFFKYRKISGSNKQPRKKEKTELIETLYHHSNEMVCSVI